MTTTCIIQARTGSTRLPGKVLQDVAGRPMLRLMLDRLAGLSVDHLVVATSDMERDEPVADIARAAGVEVVRGSEADVLDRFLTALDAFPADVVVRLTADCPLMDPAIIDAVLALRDERDADYASNVFPRTYPKGLDVEVMRAEVLRAAHAEAAPGDEREHVTPFIYRHPERFGLTNLLGPEPLGNEWWTVDTAADLAFVRGALDRVGDPLAPWTTILDAVGRNALPALGAVSARPAFPIDAAVLAALEVTSIDLDAALADAGQRVLVIERDGLPLGVARVVVIAGVGRVSLFLDPALRSPELALDALGAVGDNLRMDIQTTALHLSTIDGIDNFGLVRTLLASGWERLPSNGLETGVVTATCPRAQYPSATKASG